MIKPPEEFIRLRLSTVESTQALGAFAFLQALCVCACGGSETGRGDDKPDGAVLNETIEIGDMDSVPLSDSEVVDSEDGPAEILDGSQHAPDDGQIHNDASQTSEALVGPEAAGAFAPGQGAWSCDAPNGPCSPGWFFHDDGCWAPEPRTLIADVDPGPGDCQGSLYYADVASICIDDSQAPLEGLFATDTVERCFHAVLSPATPTWQAAQDFSPPPDAVVAVSLQQPRRVFVSNAVGVHILEGGVATSLELSPIGFGGPLRSIGAVPTVAFDASNQGALFASRPLSATDFKSAGYVRFDDYSVVPASTRVGDAEFSDPRFAADPYVFGKFLMAGAAGAGSGQPIPALAVTDDRGVTWQTLAMRGSFSGTLPSEYVQNVAVVNSHPLVAVLITQNRVLLWSEGSSTLVAQQQWLIVDSDIYCSSGACQVALALSDGSIKASNTFSVAGVAEWHERSLHPFLTKRIRLMRDGRVVVAGLRAEPDAGRVRIVNFATGTTEVVSSGLPSVGVGDTDTDILLKTVVRGLAVSADDPPMIFVNTFLSYSGR